MKGAEKKLLQAKIEEEENHEETLGKRNLLQHQKNEHHESAEDTNLRKKLSGFIEKLRSEEKRDIEDNAKMLARFIQHFACNFCVSSSNIMSVIEAQKGDIDINKVRAHFVKSFN